MIVAAIGLVSWPFTVDDAFIVARYAENLARGAGYAMNPGDPSDGVTGPLWLVPMWIAAIAGVDAIAVAKIVGLACASAAAAWVVLRARARACGRRAAIAAAAVIAVQPTIAIWGVAGLETGAATLAMTAAALGAIARPRARATLAGTSVALLAWLRPEALVAGGVLLAAIAAHDRRAGVRAIAIAAGGLVSIVAFRLAMFGDVVPLAVAAKPPDVAFGVPYVLRALIVTTSLFGLVPCAIAVRRGRKGDRAIAAAIAAHLLAVAVAGGDWMPGYRLIAPVLPLYAWLVGSGVVAMRGTRARSIAAWAFIALACALPLLDLAAQLPGVRDAGARREREGRTIARALARFDTVAMVDIGFLARESDVRVVDLGGLTDPAIARAPGGHLEKRIDVGYLASRDPDAILLHAAFPPRVNDGRLETLAGYPVEHHLAAMPWVREHYRVARVFEYTPEYFYVLLVSSRPSIRP